MLKTVLRLVSLLLFEIFGNVSEEVITLLKKIVERASEIIHTYSHLFSCWKRRISTTLQVENSLLILQTSANLLSKAKRFNLIADMSFEGVMCESAHLAGSLTCFLCNFCFE